jgi:hypothetical protein
MVEIPEPGAGMVCGIKIAVVPGGKPATERLMGALKSPLMVAVILEDPFLPSWIVSADGKAEIVKVPDAANIGALKNSTTRRKAQTIGRGLDEVPIPRFITAWRSTRRAQFATSILVLLVGVSTPSNIPLKTKVT